MPDLHPARDLPVMVRVHGGENRDGESNDYDATKPATQGNEVVVTLNYQTDFPGFQAALAFDSEGHPFAKYGLLDQKLVVKWVQKNIAAFGRDPKIVALTGQSSGSYDPAANVVSPLAEDLSIAPSLRASYSTPCRSPLPNRSVSASQLRSAAAQVPHLLLPPAFAVFRSSKS